jgi:hypothetical protein
MSDEQWLREGLAEAVPDPPTNPDRARSAERLAHRRRRTTVVAVLGSAGAVAAAAVLTVTLTSGGDDENAADPTTSESPAFVVECPPIKVGKGGIAEGVDAPDPDAPEAVPEGATSARLCQGPGTTFDVPAEALVSGVDDLVAAINDLGVTDAPDLCTSDLGPGYRIAFGYDDKSSFAVSGQLYGCHTLVVGSGYRADPEAAQAAFLGLLDEQQRRTGGETPATADAADLTCTDAQPGGGTDVGRLTAAILCVNDGNGLPRTATIEPDDLELLMDDMAAHQSVAQLRCGLEPPWPTIVATDDTGGLVWIPSECGTRFWRLPNGKAWTPSKDAVAILDQLVSEAG